MKILVISQYFWPESFRINEIVKSLVVRGIIVDVLTGKPNYPDGKIYKGYHAYGSEKEEWNGANIYRIPIFPRGISSGFRLFLNYLSFIFSGIVFGSQSLKKVKPDVIFVYAPSPLIQALVAVFLGWRKKIPVVVYVQDLWPESLEATGYYNNQIIIKFIELIVKFIYRNSKLILISSKPFEAYIQRFKSLAKIIYYPNSVNDTFHNLNSGKQIEFLGIEDIFTVVFAGNVGSAQAIEVITKAAKKINGYKNIRFIIFGSGSKLEWVKQQIEKDHLDNVLLAGRFAMEDMPYLLSKASVLLVTLANRKIFEATVPNKIQAYMAVGRPIIACMNGEGARLVVEANAGLTAPAENSGALADAVLQLFEMSHAERDKLGANGRAYYRKHFDHEKLISDLIEHLNYLVKDKI